MRLPTTRRLTLGVAFTVTALVAPALARADDVAGADALFSEAKALAGKGDYAAACPKFEASQNLGPSLGTLLNLADCYEHVGKLASAKKRWDDAAELAKAKGDDRLAFATDRATAIAAKVPKLTLRITSGAETLAVAVGGEKIPDSRWGLPLEVDPGKVDVTVSRGDAVLDTKTVEVAEGASADVTLDLGAIAKAHPAKTNKAPAPPPSPAQSIAGWITLSVGLGGMTAFGVLEGVALEQRSEADGEGGCVPKGDTVICSPQGYDLVQRAGDFAEVGQWLGVGGVLAFGVGLTLVLTAPSAEPEDAKPVAIVPLISPDGVGLVVGGSF
jgi:hypothetical protein